MMESVGNVFIFKRQEIVWKKTILWSMYQSPYGLKNKKNAISFDSSQNPNSSFSVTTGLISSMKISVYNFPLEEEAFIEESMILTLA